MQGRVFAKNKSEVDMSKGEIIPLLVNFALPLLLGNLFQQLYNTVDTWVVGNYVGNTSYSAVGTLNPIINTLIGFFTGFSNGACVIIARHFGAGNKEKVQQAVHTFVTVTLILCAFFTFLGVFLTPMLLDLIKSPQEVRVEQEIYLTIYFEGVSGLLLYNMGSAILRAVGNSVVPFLFLVVSAVINIILDLVLVICFDMGTAGVAYATIFAQMVSALMAIVLLLKAKSSVRVHIRKLRIDFSMLRGIFIVGLPAGIQMSITSFSNIFVQSYINFFGADCMGGWTTYSKVDHLIQLPRQALALSLQTFVSQNLGKKQNDRARKGVRIALLLAFACTAFLIILIVAFAPNIVRFFIKDVDSQIIYYGNLFLRLITPFYMFTCINQIYAGALRGAGKSRIPMVIMLGCYVVFRQIYLFVVSNFISNTVIPISLSYPIAWMLCSLLMTIFYFRAFSDTQLNKTNL